jgi:POT family proton-dependent oligopeptide transporter
MAEKLKHPPGLYVLFGTEAAERFSFYTMRALLVLYLTQVIFLGQYTGSLVHGEEIVDAIQADAPAVLESALGDLSREQTERLYQAVGVAPSTPEAGEGAAHDAEVPAELASLWERSRATDLIGDVQLAMTDLKTDLDGLFDEAVASVGTDPEVFGQWVIKEQVKRVVRTEALALYGLYLLLVYSSGLIGGYFADKILGSRKAIWMGGIVMCAGLFVMGIPGAMAMFYGLGLVILGNGFFKPNISTIVSGLYDEEDNRRDGAFTIFYMGINLGAFLAIFGAWVAESTAATHDWGWNIGFVVAAVGMIFSLALFHWGQKLLGTAGFPPGREVTADSRLDTKDARDIVIWSLGLSAVAVAVMSIWLFSGFMPSLIPVWLPFALGGILMSFVVFSLFRAKLGKEEWYRVIVVFVLSIFVIFFWMGFEQAGGTMTLFALEQTDRHIFGWEMPVVFFQGFNPIFIFVLAPVFSILWAWNDKHKWGLSTSAKMGWGLILLGAGFGVMYLGQESARVHGQAALYWLVLVYLIHTIAELFLSPIGLSMVTKLSPVRVVSLMMGVWFFCTAFADYLSGQMEAFTHAMGFDLWGSLIVTSVVPGVLLLMSAPLLTKWMHGRG